jgi:hypothetical protein
MSATTDDIIELLRGQPPLAAGPFDVTQARVDGIPYISGDVKGRTQDNFGRFSEMDKFAYDQELQGRDNFGGTWRGFIDDQDVLNYFNTPGLTPQAAAQYLQTYGVEPEEVASILGLTPEAARAQYNAALAPFAQATAPPATVTAPPVRTLDDDIRDFFATGPTAQEVFDAMQANNVSPEAVISAMGFDPESAMAQYNMFLNPANAPTVTDTEEVVDVITGGAAAPTTVTGPSTAAPAGGGGLFDLLPGPIQGAVTKVGEVADKVLIGAGDLLGGFDPSLVVLNPTSPSATVVFGTPSGNTTPTIIGNMPTSGAPIGVVTGNPILDYVIGEVFSRSPPGQSNPGIVDIIKDVILEEVGEATGVNAGAVASAAQGDVGGLIDAATKVVVGVNKSVAETDEKYKTQEEINRAATGTDQVTDLLEREPTNVDGGPTPVQPGGTAGPGGEETDTDDIITLLGDSPIMGPDKAAADKAAADKAAADKAATDKAAADKAATDKAAADKAAADKAVADKAATDKAATDKAAADKAAADKAAADKAAADKAAADKAAADKAAADKAAADKAAADKAATDKAAADKAAADKAAADKAATDTKTTTTTPVVTTPVTDTGTDTKTTTTTPVVTTPVTDTGTDTKTTTTTPVVTTPVTDTGTDTKTTTTTPVVTTPVTDTGTTKTTTTTPVVTTPVTDTDTEEDKVVVKEGVPPKVVSPDGPVTPPKVTTVTPPGTPGVIPAPIRQPQTAQGMYSVGTEKAGVADIGTPYDLNATLLDNIMRILAEGDAGTEETELYGGGSVNGYNATDEIIKLLRG